MRIALAVLLLCIAYATSYPSFREAATDNDESNNDLELELRSILNYLDDEKDNDEQMTRAVSSEDEDSDSEEEDTNQMSKRQGGHNVIDQQSKCEITCIHSQRNPEKGKGKTIKEAAKACKNVCNASSKKRGGKKTVVQKKSPKPKFNLRDLDDSDDSNNNDEEQQENQRREFYDYLMQQLQENNDE